jgi:hypothetical protein
MTQALIRILGSSLVLLLAACSAQDAQKARTDPARGATGEIATAAAPGISVAQPVFDFGEVDEGEQVVHVFEIRNTGAADLLVERARGS